MLSCKLRELEVDAHFRYVAGLELRQSDPIGEAWVRSGVVETEARYE